MATRPSFLEALMRSDPRMRVGDHVFVPVDDDGWDEWLAPDQLRSPMRGYPGIWNRESPPEERPARYYRAG